MGIRRAEGHLLWIGGPVPPGSSAITLGSLVIVRRGHERSERLMRHELEHVHQWRRLGVARFLATYLGDYLRHRLRGRSHRGAYRRIPLEIEAEWVARRPPAGSATAR